MNFCERSTKYRKHLAKMCKVLSHSRVVQQKSHFLNGVFQFENSLQANEKKRKDYSLALNPNWKVDITGNPLECGIAGHTELHFGGEIIFKDYCLNRQVLTVVVLFRAEEDAPPTIGRPCISKGENHIVRRFHFDFDRNANNSCTPLAHLQIGGNLNREYLDIQQTRPFRYELFDELDFPRLPWTIADLPLVMDIFLRQFKSELDEFIESREWRALVVDSERLWLKDFLLSAANMMKSNSDRIPLYEYWCKFSAYDQ